MGEEKRIIIEMPPRHGKSELSTVHFPAWYLGKFPQGSIGVTSANEDLASEFSVRSRDIFAEWGPELFGFGIRPDIHARGRWETTAGGMLRAVGAGSGCYGRGFSCILVDDYFGKIEQALSEAERKRIHQWYYGTIRNRLEPGGVIIVVASRTHPKDLNGKLVADSKIGGEQWKVFQMPAIGSDGAALWPERFSLADLNAIKAGYTASGYPWLWSALYQQDPPDVLDSEWDSDYFGDHIWYDDWEYPPNSDIIWKCMALDPSVGESERGDYSALVMLAVDKQLTCWIDADIQRRDIVRMGSDGLDWYRRFQPREWGVETIAFQKVLRGEFEREALRRGMIATISGITHGKVGKIPRIKAAVTPALAQRLLRFRKGSPGCGLLVEQLKGFPTCKFDDGPDSLSMVLTLAANAVNSGRAFGSEGLQAANDMRERIRG